MANTTKNLGIVSPVPMGEWASGIIYQKLNIVRHNGASYLAKQLTATEPGVSSSWESYWQLIAKDGPEHFPFNYGYAETQNGYGRL